MKNKDLEKAIKNLQKIVESRKGGDQLEEAIRILKEEKGKEGENEGSDIPLPIAISAYCGLSSGPWWALGGFAIGKILEEFANRSEVFSKMLDNLCGLVYEINKDQKKKEKA